MYESGQERLSGASHLQRTSWQERQRQRGRLTKKEWIYTLSGIATVIILMEVYRIANGGFIL